MKQHLFVFIALVAYILSNKFHHCLKKGLVLINFFKRGSRIFLDGEGSEKTGFGDLDFHTFSDQLK